MALGLPHVLVCAEGWHLVCTNRIIIPEPCTAETRCCSALYCRLLLCYSPRLRFRFGVALNCVVVLISGIADEQATAGHTAGPATPAGAGGR